MSTIKQTDYKLPLAVISNGQITGNTWENPDNILLVDGDTTDSDSNTGSSSDIIVGNFNFNIPENSVITGIKFKVIGKWAGVTTPPTTLTFYAVDNTTGVNLFYPYLAPFDGFTTELEEYVFGTSSYQFATSWTVNQINNLKLQLVANGSISIDAVLMQVFYYDETVEPTPTPDGDTCVSCDSPIQAQPFSLALPLTGTDTGMYVKSFNTPRGVPITMDDVSECGDGSIIMVIDQGQPYGNGNPWEETVRVINVVAQPNGTVYLDFGSLDNRGLGFTRPYTSDTDNISEHDANSEVVISNAAVYENQKVRQCQADTIFSPPIQVDYNDTPITYSLHDMNFQGAGVVAYVDPDDSHKVIVNIAGSGGTTPPSVVSSSSSGTGATQATTLAWDHESLGINRGLLVQISTEQTKTVTGVTFNGVALTQVESNTDATNNIRQEQWFLVAPPAGTYEIEITMSAAAYITAGAETLTGVDQTTPIGSIGVGVGDSLTPSVGLTTTYDNSLIIDGLGTALTPILYTKGLNQVENWHITANGNTRQGGSSIQMAGDAPDNVVMDWTLTQTTDWVITAVEIKGITSESGGGGGAVDLDVNQTAHGFSVGQLLRSAGTDNTYALALADTGAHADIVGIVKEVVDANNFVMTKDAYFNSTSVPVGTPGSAVFLSAVTPGLMVLTSPVTPGLINKPVGIITSSGQEMTFSIDIRGSVVGSGGGGTGTVESVTGLNTDNTDPDNPIVQISVDGVTITGAGTPGSPLVATGGGSGVGLSGGGTKIAIDTTQVTVSNTATATPLFNESIPGGILDTNNAIRFVTQLSNLEQNAGVGQDLTIDLSYGGDTIQLVLPTPNNDVNTNGGYIEGFIVANGTTGTQKASITLYTTVAGGEQDGDTAINISKIQGVITGTMTVDSTVAQDLEVIAQWESASVNSVLVSQFTIIEKITGASVGGSLVISGLLAGEPLTGATTPQAVFEGTNTILTTLQSGVQNAITFHVGSYDFVGRTSGATSQIQLNPNRRATNFTTPSHTVTVNQLIFSCESNTNGTQSGNTLTASIYTDSGGAPSALLLQRTSTNVPLVNNEYTINVPFPDNETLAANTTYWLVLEWDLPDDPGNFSNLYLDVANVGTGLLWNGSAWVASDPFIFCLVLSPYKGYVYKSLQVGAQGERGAFLGMTSQTIAAGGAIDVIRDGVVVGFTGLTVGIPSYLSASTPGVLAGSGSHKVAWNTKATEIVVSRYTGIYQ